MYTLSGIIVKAVNSATTGFETLGYVGTNMANYNTVGYKTQSFANYLKSDGRIEGTLRTNYSNGALFTTKKPLDVAINGAGFIPVTEKNGSTAYTRDGAFTVNSEGYLTTSDGCLVADGIKIPANYEKLTIEKNGDIFVLADKSKEAQKIGKIPLVNFLNPEGLDRIDGNKLLATEKSGKPSLVKDHDYIRQGSLERSNVDIYSTVHEAMIIGSGIRPSLTMIKLTDDLYRQSINLRQ